MFNDPSIMGSTSQGSEDHEEEDEQVREIHALTPTHPPHPRGRPWDTLHTHRSSSLSVASTDGGASSSDNFTTMSREFNALVLAGSSIDPDNNRNLTPVNQNNVNNNLGRIREDELMEETNPLAIVPDNHPLDPVPSSQMGGGAREEHVSVQRVKKEEVDTKISAWQNAKVAKINNRFKREDAVINGWESEQVQKASSWMKKVEVTFLFYFSHAVTYLLTYLLACSSSSSFIIFYVCSCVVIILSGLIRFL